MKYQGHVVKAVCSIYSKLKKAKRKPDNNKNTESIIKERK